MATQDSKAMKRAAVQSLAQLSNGELKALGFSTAKPNDKIVLKHNTSSGTKTDTNNERSTKGRRQQQI